MNDLRNGMGPVEEGGDGVQPVPDFAPPVSAADRPLLISIVVPCFNEQEALGALHSALRELAGALREEGDYRMEFILVDDGSHDGTWPLICGLAAQDTRLRGVQLSRNFGHQAALACGYRHASGDAVVTLDADLQDPPEVVPEMVRAWRDGADVVFASREARVGDTWFKRGTAWLFYWGVNQLGGDHVRRNVGDFRLMSRRCVDVLNTFPERTRFFRDLAGWIGFPSTEVRYRRQARRAGSTKYTFRRMWRLAWEGFVSASTRPLRYSWYAAAFAIVLSSCLFVMALLVSVPSTPLLLSAILFATAMVSIGQGIQGLYLARLFEECRHRPTYVVSDCTSPRAEIVTLCRKKPADRWN